MWKPPDFLTSRFRRYRGWLILLAISLGWKFVVLTLGAAVPRWVIGDGVGHLPVGDRGSAMEGKAIARALWDHPLERLGLVQALRVLSVDTTRTAASYAVGTIPVCRGPVVHVRAYTYFAIPYSEARTACDTGVVEYRVFRRHR
jgi:hypothetical protein